jgi:hypothetical protein
LSALRRLGSVFANRMELVNRTSPLGNSIG